MDSFETNDSSNRSTYRLGTPVDQFIIRRQQAFPEATGKLTQLLQAIVSTSKTISKEVNRAGLIRMEGSAEGNNVQGKKQRMLDIIADVHFNQALIKSKQVVAILSKEREGIVDTGHKEAKYVIAIDSLDGSSNIDVNISVGTIFSIYERLSKPGDKFELEDFLQAGIHQVAAGYVLYGASTMLVYTTGDGVNGFTYDPSLAQYFLSHPNIIQPDSGPYYSINEKHQSTFPTYVKTLLQELKDREMSVRYVGSLVGDFHRNLLKGGIYLYPSSQKYESGKLRLVYECNALAMIAEQASGAATDGKNRILEIKPNWHYQKTPFYVGSKDLMRTLGTG